MQGARFTTPSLHMHSSAMSSLGKLFLACVLFSSSGLAAAVLLILGAVALFSAKIGSFFQAFTLVFCVVLASTIV